MSKSNEGIEDILRDMLRGEPAPEDKIDDIIYYLDDLLGDPERDGIAAEYQRILDDTLADVYGMVKICGYEYEPGSALRDVDPVTWRCLFLDALHADLSEIGDDLRRGRPLPEWLSDALKVRLLGEY